MSEVVESLLLLSRADAGHALIRWQPVDLGAHAERVMGLLGLSRI